eukprot:3681594-Karenia_brevis.AAC.1
MSNRERKRKEEVDKDFDPEGILGESKRRKGMSEEEKEGRREENEMKSWVTNENKKRREEAKEQEAKRVRLSQEKADDRA